MLPVPDVAKQLGRFKGHLHDVLIAQLARGNFRIRMDGKYIHRFLRQIGQKCSKNFSLAS